MAVSATELEELRGAIADAAELRADLEQAEIARDRLARELSDAAATISSLQAELGAARSEVGVAPGGVDQLDADLVAALERTESEGVRLAEELNDARAEIARLEADLAGGSVPSDSTVQPVEDAQIVARHAEEVDALLSQIASMERESTALSSHLKASTSHVADLEVEAAGLRAEVARLTDMSDVVSAESVELQSARTTIADLERSLEETRLELSAVQTDVASAVDGDKIASDKVASLESDGAKLRRDLAASEQARAGIWARMQSMLQENIALKDELREGTRAAAAQPPVAPAPSARPPYQEPLEQPAPSVEPTPVMTLAAVPGAASSVASDSAGGGAELEVPAQPLAVSDRSLVMVEEPIANRNDADQVVLAVTGWASAWSSQDVDRYLGFYSAAFLPDSGIDRNAWEDQRRDRIGGPSSIAVDVQEITTHFVDGDRAITTFVQQYASESYSDTVTKTLEWVRDSGTWRIASEVSAPLG